MAAKEKKMFTDEQKKAILAEVGVDGVSNKEVAKRHGINEGSLYAWRNRFAAKAAKKKAARKSATAKSKQNAVGAEQRLDNYFFGAGEANFQASPKTETIKVNSMDDVLKFIVRNALRNALADVYKALS